MFPAGQVVSGDVNAAQARLRAGGWVVLSRQLAEALHAHVGGSVVLPTPTGPVTYRLAATTSNLGWSAGAIAMNLVDLRRAWRSADPTALEVDTGVRASVAATRRAIQARLGPESSLRVQTSAGRGAEADALAREGLGRLSQIVLLLIAAAALAMAAAMGASIWQRRPSLASLRIQTFTPAQLRVILLSESGLVLATGCLAGAAAGIYGHALIDRYLRVVSGFPAPYAIALPQAAATVAAIVGAALLALAIPGYVASRVSPALALQDPA
jgi:putative ABC transport system permease protein